MSGDAFHKGDRVRLTARCAATATKGFARFRRSHHRVDWTTREGTVIATPLPTSSDVSIMWDDSKGHDHWPKAAIERIEP